MTTAHVDSGVAQKLGEMMAAVIAAYGAAPQTQTTQRQFDDDQMLERQEVEEITRMSKSWIYLAIKRGEFPAPIRCGRAVRWRMAAIREWMVDRQASN